MRSETENQPQQQKLQPGRSMNAPTSTSWKQKASGVFTAAALFMLIALGSRALAVTVGTCEPGQQYSTIQAAVTAATPGSTVNICPGTYPEQVLITKNLHLVGVASGTKHSAVVTSPAGGLVMNGSDIFGNPVAAQIFVQNAT